MLKGLGGGFVIYYHEGHEEHEGGFAVKKMSFAFFFMSLRGSYKSLIFCLESPSPLRKEWTNH